MRGSRRSVLIRLYHRGRDLFLMRTAALYDIHGNLPALEAALNDARIHEADRIVVGGDVLPGPMPAQCLDLLLAVELPVTFIVGNGEVAVIAERDGRDSGLGPYRPMLQWVAAQLTDVHVRAIASWPKTARLDDVLFCHATPRDENEFVNAATADATIVSIFEAAGAPVVVCGHTHVQYDRRAGRVRIVNAGSVGMPFDGGGTCWLLIDGEPRLMRTAYDVQTAARTIAATAYPGAADFAENYVIRGKAR
jgi:diadenosine tetraphosphatase ApaH/serine/threonine PP2A family protein phosphatase